jgi:hypothetical protein
MELVTRPYPTATNTRFVGRGLPLRRVGGSHIKEVYAYQLVTRPYERPTIGKSNTI